MQNANLVQISFDDYKTLTSEFTALIEVCELHSHGNLVEVMLVTSATDLTDGEDTTHYIVASGHIKDDCFNVTHIGDSYAFTDNDDFHCKVINADCDNAQSIALAYACEAITPIAARIDSN